MLPRAICVTQTNEIEYESSSERMAIRQQVYAERKYQLLEPPLCKYCAERGLVTPATICDHIEPHGGDVNKFGSFPSRPCASPATTAPSALWRRAAIVPMSGSMVGRLIPTIRPIGRGEDLGGR